MKLAWTAAVGLWLSASALWAGPQVEVTLLDGSARKGELTVLSATNAQLLTDQGEQNFPVDQLMQITNLAAEESGEPTNSIAVRLADQSLLTVETLESDGTHASLSEGTLGTISLSVRQISDVRFSPLDEKVSGSWEDLRNRNVRDDLLVIRKGEVLDYVSGSVGKLTAETVTMLVRDKELSAPRGNVFGIVFAARAAAAAPRSIGVQTDSGDLLQAESATLAGEEFHFTTAWLKPIEIPVTRVRRLDFGGGRIRFLADLPFDDSLSRAVDAEHPVPWFVSRNAPAGSGGRLPLVIGKQEYRRGLWLHSGAVLRYRLNREFTRLRATAGFDLTHVTRMPRFEPAIRLVIVGDEKELFAKEFHWNDEPQPLDVNLADVRELVIRVESSGSQQGILEHFALGDAQVIQ